MNTQDIPPIYARLSRPERERLLAETIARHDLPECGRLLLSCSADQAEFLSAVRESIAAERTRRAAEGAQ